MGHPSDNACEESLMTQTAAVNSITVEINAPAQLVWDVLVDFEKYGAWNPFNPKVEAVLKVGEAITMQVVMGDPNAASTMTEYFTRIDGPHHLAWEVVTSAETGDKVTHDHYIESLSPTRCTYRHSDTFTGPSAAGVVAQFGDGIKAAFDAVANALKQRAESLHNG